MEESGRGGERKKLEGNVGKSKVRLSLVIHLKGWGVIWRVSGGGD